MKDWFYASGDEVVCVASGTEKSLIVKTIKSGFDTPSAIENKLGIKFAESELEDANALIKFYAPMSYANQSGCSGCGGCAAKDKC